MLLKKSQDKTSEHDKLTNDANSDDAVTKPYIIIKVMMITTVQTTTIIIIVFSYRTVNIQRL